MTTVTIMITSVTTIAVTPIEHVVSRAACGLQTQPRYAAGCNAGRRRGLTPRLDLS